MAATERTLLIQRDDKHAAPAPERAPAPAAEAKRALWISGEAAVRRYLRGFVPLRYLASLRPSAEVRRRGGLAVVRAVAVPLLWDLLAGLTVGVLLIPQAMAYAKLASLPPVYGLYTAALTPWFYALFGTCAQLSIGPTATIALLLAEAINKQDVFTVEDTVAVAVQLCFFCGIFLTAMSVLRLGRVANFLSYPVISGYTSGVTITIFASQLVDFLGIPSPPAGSPTATYYKVYWACKNVPETNLVTLALSVVASIILLICLFFKKIPRWIPGPVVVLLLGEVAGVCISVYDDYGGVKLVGTIPAGLPKFALPQFGVGDTYTLLVSAATITIVACADTIALGKNMSMKHSTTKIVDTNQDLLALGTGELFGAFFGCHPSSSSFPRTGVADAIGAKSPLNSAITASLLAVTLLFLCPVFQFLPNAILASMVVVSVIPMFDYEAVCWYCAQSSRLSCVVGCGERASWNCACGSSRASRSSCSALLPVFYWALARLSHCSSTRAPTYLCPHCQRQVRVEGACRNFHLKVPGQTPS
eukprot:TRINITY_DN10163_c0_g1_i2.p1 TRINITY_DN10163_c0_g1~~TRINITY_DN10163_c0_g1_i2.p1  ORF type:complete len:548 (-),score=97.07 TRINITY_DN10163_c0_g1_i2:254-1849(-)